VVGPGGMEKNDPPHLSPLSASSVSPEPGGSEWHVSWSMGIDASRVAPLSGNGRWTLLSPRPITKEGTLSGDTDPIRGGSEEPADFDGLHDAIQTFTRVDPLARRVEVLAAVILALATIASSWSLYQANRWGGVQTEAYAQAGAAQADSVRAADLADAQFTVDVDFFAIWLDEVGDDVGQGGDGKIVALLERAFRPEFVLALEPWLATDPLVNQDGPATPFDMEEYVIAAAQQAEEFRSDAEAAAAVAADANQSGDNYVLTTVLFASVLFFAGISSKFSGRWVRITLVMVGFLAFLAGSLILATFPVH
jgi:hypothetical protein